MPVKRSQMLPTTKRAMELFIERFPKGGTRIPSTADVNAIAAELRITPARAYSAYLAARMEGKVTPMLKHQRKQFPKKLTPEEKSLRFRILRRIASHVRKNGSFEHGAAMMIAREMDIKPNRVVYVKNLLTQSERMHGLIAKARKRRPSH